MTLFLAEDALRARRQLVQDPGALGGLAASLQRELHAAVDVPVPDGKSRLTRHGGRCVTCTVLLRFDPRSPHAHTCPQCGTVYTDQVHHEWWLMNGHLWTAEQATRAAALAYLLDDGVAASRADAILDTYTERYLRWPNRDNALGPTRPFFSTYLESIWLLHLAAALDLRIAAAGGTRSHHAATLDRLIAPSAALIAGFDEGRSNRQVWHAAALLAAGGVLGDAGMRERAASSVRQLLHLGLHDDGSWYEGENYHLFAHRGLLCGVTLAERVGLAPPAPLRERFERGFAAPFRTMFPDGTFPARRDSQYGVTLRQFRTADWVECGLARRDTPELRAALASLYATWPPAGDTFRWASSADAERNMPGVRLSRADCSWRALLLARAELPPLHDAEPRSELLEGQGIAVFRRDRGRLWVGLDYGDPGAGHGHPDRLNLVIATPDERWLDDAGAGSYTSPTLAWYRSSMAHNAPLVNGRDQGAAAGRLLAHEERGAIGWVSAEFIDPVSKVRFERSIVVTADHLVDELTWTSSEDVTVDVPLQARLLHVMPDRSAPFIPATSQDAWLTDAASMPLAGGRPVLLHLASLPSPARAAPDREHTFQCLVWSASAATLWRAGTIGPPAGHPHGLVSLRQHGTSGRSVRIMAWPLPPVHADVIGAEVTVDTIEAFDMRAPRRTTHTRTSTGWYVEAVGSVTALDGRRAAAAPTPAHSTPDDPVPIHVARDGVFQRTLGLESYRPTEASWHEAGQPTGTVHVRQHADALHVTLSAMLGRAPHFAPAVPVNPLDNELADVNSDGAQLHWRSALGGTWNSVMAVPEGDGVRLTAAEGGLDGLTAVAERRADGFALTFIVPWPAADRPFVFDAIVNDCPPERERRRGQLVLSGAHGDFAYLRGARQSPDRAVHVVFDPAAS